MDHQPKVDEDERDPSHHGKESLRDMVSHSLRKLRVPVPKLKGRYALLAEKQALKWSMLAVQLGVFAHSVSVTILRPNYPFLASPGVDKDSFPNTDPFGFSGATYFLPMTALLGTAITSAFIGAISDRVGRRPCMLVCIGCTAIGQLATYFARESFWAYCATNFVSGLFGGALPVALAYVADIHPSRVEKDKEIGSLIGVAMIGMSGGGVVAIFMEDNGLFMPLFVSSAICSFAFIVLSFLMIEPSASFHFDEEVDENDQEGPEKINWRLFGNVLVGALFDGIGSSGLSAMALSPLAFDIFYSNFMLRGEEPIMSDTTFKWISTLVALMIIPGAAVSTPLYAKIGAAGGCVFGNVITAGGICACLYIAKITPPTTGTLIGFIVALYAIFPLTVVSQLSTGPMLDMLSPKDKRGFSQGMNTTVMNFANAISPFLLGTLADSAGISVCLWTCIGISLFAALINAPLMLAEELKRSKVVDDIHDNDEKYTLFADENSDLIDRIMSGKWVPAGVLMSINEARFEKGLPLLIQPVGEYEDDKNRLIELRRHADEDFKDLRGMLYKHLNSMEDDAGRKEYLVTNLKKSSPSGAEIDKIADDLGRWFGQYMKDSGYLITGGSAMMHKQMIMKAFPVVNKDKEITVENIERGILRYLAIANDYLLQEQQSSVIQSFAKSAVI